MIRLNNITLGLDITEENLTKKAARVLKIPVTDIKKVTIIKKAVDARNKKNIFFVYTLDITLHNEKEPLEEVCATPVIKASAGLARPIIIGAGPAGLFAALMLAEANMHPIIIERGYPVTERTAHVETFFKDGNLNPQSNVQFGEGGAGTFSDGKLTTGIKDPRIHKVISELIAMGAPAEIKYTAKPHIGTDKLAGILINIRKKIESLGGEYRFNTQLTDISTNNSQLKSITLKHLPTGALQEIPTNALILAIGHSARDTFEMLYDNNANMEAKPFSIGVRIEHKQSSINKAQYGDFWNHPRLGAADYKLNVRAGGRGLYTFCMCPGGQVVSAASEIDRLAVNGMSRYKRDMENANSAVLVSVSPSDFGTEPLSGIAFQREIESRAFCLGGGNYFAPVQLLGDFLNNKKSTMLGDIAPSIMPGYTLTDLQECLPEFIVNSLKSALPQMGRKLQGFDCYDAVLTAVESRSSSPVRILRDHHYESNIAGLFPCGEGAGYAGGIMSSCVDGIRCAEALIRLFQFGRG